MINNFTTLGQAIAYTRAQLITYGEVVKTESWQGIKQERKMFEALNIYWSAQMPNSLKLLMEQVKPDLPWAENHFNERVSGFPDNPGRTYKEWPGYKDVSFNDKNFRNVGEKFSHTYMERYWPKKAGHLSDTIFPGGKRMFETDKNIMGIRYEYGDLWDIIKLLKKEPFTRQAYMPIWFPEDTGVLHGGRVPCTIGYHFIMRHNKLHIHYQIRACDFIRHFKNDVYLTVRLAMWVLNELKLDGQTNRWEDVELGIMTMDIVSLHVFEQEKNLI